MALCVRRLGIIETLLSKSCRHGADLVAKAVRNNMPKMARAVATKYCASKVAL